MDLAARLATLGHLASRRQLVDLGYGRAAIDSALSGGPLVPVRPGWVATPAATQLAVIAVLHGARLTGASALGALGVWNGADRDIHLQLPPNAHRVEQRPLTPIAVFRPPRFAPGRIVKHWSEARPSPTRAPAWTVGTVDAVSAFCRRHPDEHVVAAIESAVHTRAMSRRDLPMLVGALPRRLRRLVSRIPFSAESGLESVARFRLEALGLSLVAQVAIGPDRVDLVIDGWLVIELDGDEWHDPVKDRARTNRLIRAGYAVLRFGYADVFGGWDDLVATIYALLGDAARTAR
ncbi:MAG: hypothetical protein RI885_2453 [Actinomycetota bacterium]|jgi:very-short-patch-repair endonuclease